MFASYVGKLHISVKKSDLGKFSQVDYNHDLTTDVDNLMFTISVQYFS